MFIYICQTPSHFQFTKKINKWNSQKVYLVVCSCLLVIFGRLLVVCGHFMWLLVVCWWFVVVCVRLMVVCGRLMAVCDYLLEVCSRLLVVCGHLLVVCDRLCLLVMVCGRLWSLPLLVTTVLKYVNIFLSLPDHTWKPK